MKIFDTGHIKNVVLIGSSGAGKTTLAESMLFEGKIIDRRGDIDSKNTSSDHKEIEHENGNSVFSSVMHTVSGNTKINFIDTAGMDDFVGGMIAALHVVDTGVMVVNAQNGVEVGTEIHTRHIKNFNKAMAIAVNHLDHEKANFDSTIEQLKERVSPNIIIVQYPVNAGDGFDSVIDLVKMKMLKFPAGGGNAEILDIPADEKDKADELYAELVEKAAESDEALMEKFFETESLTEEEMLSGLKEGIKQKGLYPVFCVAAKQCQGVSRLMEAMSELLPGPADVDPHTDEEEKAIECDASKPASAFVFKSSLESHVGEINYFKVISGTITESLDMLNLTTNTKERVSQIFASAGKKRIKIEKIVAGDIGSTVKLKNTKTNSTLAENNSFVEFPKLKFPEPKFRTAIKPLAEGDEEKMGDALGRMSQEDPTYVIEYSKELKQVIIHGQGEYHINILKWHLDNIYKVETEFIPPRIPYRETITKVAQADYRHKKQSGGAGQFGEVHIVIQPFEEGAPDPSKFKVNGKELNISIRGKDEHIMPWGGKLIFYNCIVGGSIDARFLPAILKGIMEKMEEGPLTGSYARDICVFVYDGKMHPVDSNEISFKLAGRNAFRMAFKEAGPKILEPIYLVEVLVPSERMGDVMSDLQGRRAIVQGMSSEGGYEKITAKVPLAEMNKYSTALSSLTQGRAMYSMTFSEYGQVPGDIQTELIKTYEEEQED